jgi:hypothetical protein
MPSEQQLEFSNRRAGETQAETILRLLQSAAGNPKYPDGWIGVLELHHQSESLAVHSRINDLRQLGHIIEQESRWVERRCHSYYRWMNFIPPDK